LSITGLGHEYSKVQYRPDIDGLRAVSIILVVAYHAQPWLVSGGFIGVDIFFVISGFLITQIVLRELASGNFSWMQFYSRRIRRIFPALMVVLLVTYLVGWFILLPSDFSLLGESMAAGVAFVSNLFQLTQISYFAPNVAENPLIHLWSLGIEEQFYIFWPLILWLLAGAKRPGFWMVAIATASFCVSLLIFAGYKDGSFYSPISRAWELLAGGVVASQCVRGSKQGETKQTAPWEELSSLLGVATIVGAALSLTKESQFPGFYALLPVLGAVLIIVSPGSTVNRFLLSNKLMILIGLISYPLYLWHWPLLAYLTIIRNGVPNFLEVWVTIVFAVGLSWLTFHFVEIPLRQKAYVVARLCLALITMGIVGMITVAASGFGFRFSPEIRDIALLPQKNNAGFLDRCFLEAPGAKFDAKCIEQGGQPLLFLWGDSTAAALLPGLKKAQEIVPFRLARFASPGCMPILAAGSNARCDETNDIVFGYLKSSRPETVLLHAMWDHDSDLIKLAETIRQLKALNIPRIVILGAVPVWKRSLPHSMVNYYRFRHTISDRLATGVSGPEGDDRMQVFSKAAAVEYISARRVLCNLDGCLTRIGSAANDVVTSDAVHLSDNGSDFLIKEVSGALFTRP